jgi:hypothetical protein
MLVLCVCAGALADLAHMIQHVLPPENIAAADSLLLLLKQLQMA